MYKYILITGLFSLLGNSIFAQSTVKEEFKRYRDICFCSVGLSHPRQILSLDNNMELLFALRTEQTLHELDKSGVKFTESQITLLELSGLIGKRDSVYHTLIPILSQSKTTYLREQTRQMAASIISRFQSELDAFLKTLNTKGMQNNSYSLFFAYVMDGLVWDILEQDKDIEETVITEEKPFWDGTYWMTEPKRTFSCGTNSLSSDDVSIHVNWSDISLIHVSSYKMLGELLNDYKVNGKITNPDVFKAFEKNDLFTKEGELKIPVLKADSTDHIYVQSLRIANKVVEYLRNNIDYPAILIDCESLTKGQKITILYHEIMWDILDILESNGRIRKPVAFGNPHAAKEKDLKDLIFIVKD